MSRYIERCVATLVVGIVVRPKAFARNAKGDRVILHIDREEGFCNCKTSGGRTTAVRFKELVGRYDWDGKPGRRSKRLPFTEGTGGMVPLWSAVHRLEERLASLERGLGVG